MEYGIDPSASDESVLQALALDAKLKGQDNHSLTNPFSRFFMGQLGGSLSTLLGSGADVDGYMENGKFVPRTCFVKGTLVTIVKREYSSEKAIGLENRDKSIEILIPIEEVRIGDVVLTKNEKTGKELYRPVTELFRHQIDFIHYLGLLDGAEFGVTWNHPIYIKGKGWTEVKDIQTGDVVVLANEKESIVSYNKTVSLPDTTVYNFEVEDTHSYFVGEKEVWVHNYATDKDKANFEKILSKQKTKEDLEVNLSADSKSKIIKKAGEDGVTLIMEDGTKLKLKSVDDLNELISKTGGVNAYNSSKTVDEMLRTAVPEYYKQFSDGNSNASNKYGEGAYNYKNTIQGNYEQPNAKNNKTLTFSSYHTVDNPGHATTINPEVEVANGTPARFLLCNELNCVYGAKINTLKSVGLIRPDATVYDVASMIPQKTTRYPDAKRDIVTDPYILAQAEKSDWAKLTGNSKYEHKWKDFGEYNPKKGNSVGLNNPKAIEYLNSGKVLVVNMKSKGHILNVKKCTSSSCTPDDPLDQYNYVDTSLNHNARGVIRKQR
jgi:hypothetical protein